MSETSEPGRQEPAGNQEQQSGAEAPASPAQAPPAQQTQPPPPPPPATPAPKRPARTVKLWLAALVGGLLLLGGGLGGFFIGYAADNHPDRPGAVWHDRGPHNVPDWPDRPPRDR